MAKTLTPWGIESTKPDAKKRREVPDDGCRGLYLVVQPEPSGKKSWAIRYRFEGETRKLTLGPVLNMVDAAADPVGEPRVGAPLTLGQARVVAAQELLKVLQGRDPARELLTAKRAKKPIRRRDRWEEVAEDFVTRHCKVNNKPGTAAETERLLKSSVTPKWEGMHLAEITQDHVLDLLDDIAAGDPKTERRPAPIARNRVRAALLTLFGWAKERGLVTASPVAGIRPLSSKGRSRKRALDDNELRVLWIAAGRLGFPFDAFYRVLVLTGARLSEVADMQLAEIDLKKRLWILPGARSKNSEEHVFPLSDQAAAVLEAHLLALDKAMKAADLKNPEGYVFTTTGSAPVSGFTKAKARLDREMLAVAREAAVARGEDDAEVQLKHFVPHDLRRTLVGGLVRLQVRESVADAILAHKGEAKSGVAGVYNRHDYIVEATAALKKWGKHVDRLVTPRLVDDGGEIRSAKA